MKKITVIVPIYNCEDLLNCCVDSICEQTIDKDLIEVILVDDASTDRSLEKCREYAERFEYIQVLALSENGGQSRARNEGFALASGEYLFYADADDWLGPDCLRMLLSHAEEKQTDVTIGRVVAVDRSEKAGRVVWCRSRIEEIGGDDFEENWDFYASMGPWGRLIKKDLLESNNIEFPSDIYMFEDIYWNMQVLHHASSAVLLNDYDYYFLRRDSGNASLTTNEKEITNSIRPENVYHSIDSLCSLAEEYGYGEEHPSWKRTFMISVKDGIDFVTTAARIDPETYPHLGREFKDKIWERVSPHYSSWVRCNIGTELVCRLDGMAAGYDFDYDGDPIRYFAFEKYGLTEAAEKLKGHDIGETMLPDYLSEEAVLRLAGEQAVSYAFYSLFDIQDGAVSGDYFIKLKVTDGFRIEMDLHAGQEVYPAELTMKPHVWGEEYQESGEWTARADCDAEKIKRITYRVMFGDMEVASGNVKRWNEDLGRPDVLDTPADRLRDTRERLADTRTRLSDTRERLSETKIKLKESQLRVVDLKDKLIDTRANLKETKEKLKDTKAKLKEARAKISSMRNSTSWKITKPLRKVSSITKGNNSQNND